MLRECKFTFLDYLDMHLLFTKVLSLCYDTVSVIPNLLLYMQHNLTSLEITRFIENNYFFKWNNRSWGHITETICTFFLLFFVLPIQAMSTGKEMEKKTFSVQTIHQGLFFKDLFFKYPKTFTCTFRAETPNVKSFSTITIPFKK